MLCAPTSHNINTPSTSSDKVNRGQVCRNKNPAGHDILEQTGNVENACGDPCPPPVCGPIMTHQCSVHTQTQWFKAKAKYLFIFLHTLFFNTFLRRCFRAWYNLTGLGLLEIPSMPQQQVKFLLPVKMTGSSTAESYFSYFNNFFLLEC